MAPVTPAAPRVLFVTHSGVLGGAERSLLDLAEHWPAERRLLVLAEGPMEAAARARGIPVEVMPLGALSAVRRESARPGLGALADAARVSARIAREAAAVDVIHANSQKAFVVAAGAGLLARRPVAWHLRDILTPRHFSVTNIKAAVLLANARAATVIANSGATAAAFAAAGGRAGLARVVHNGLASDRFDAVTDAETRALRDALGAGDAPVLAVCARLAPWKGQHVALAALAALPAARLWIIGKALFGEDDYARGLVDHARALGVWDRVRFLGEREDVPALLCAADVVLHTAVEAEPFGRVVVEGMLAGRPVVASDDGGVREILRAGESGWLVPPGDPAALAAAVRDVLAMPAAERAARVARAREEARSRFSVEAMLAGVVAALAAVSAPRSRT